MAKYITKSATVHHLSGKMDLSKKQVAAFLDEIHPNRIKTAEQWFRREDQLGRELGKGSLWERVQPENWRPDSPILKGTADRRQGKL